MAIGIVRFNFTTTAEHTIDSIEQLILARLAGSTIDPAPNTFAIQLTDRAPSDQLPPTLPGFHQIQGTIRRRS